MFFPMNQGERPIKQGPTKTMLASIDDVSLEAGGDVNTCRVLVRPSNQPSKC